MPPRDPRIDWLKGFAALSVLVIHSHALRDPLVYHQFLNRAVPIFILLFGLTSDRWWATRTPAASIATATVWYRTRLPRLLVPASLSRRAPLSYRSPRSARSVVSPSWRAPSLGAGTASWGIYLGQIVVFNALLTFGVRPEQLGIARRWLFAGLVLIGAVGLIVIGEQVRALVAAPRRRTRRAA
jgi:peptidoglycan/LPS O-acetylase OafA/YrhL